MFALMDRSNTGRRRRTEIADVTSRAFGVSPPTGRHIFREQNDGRVAFCMCSFEQLLSDDGDWL